MQKLGFGQIININVDDVAEDKVFKESRLAK